MLIHEIKADRADAIEAGLADARRLGGAVVIEECAPARYHMLPAFSDPDGCVALTGLDRELVRIKLLRNHDRSLVMIEGSATPFV